MTKLSLTIFRQKETINKIREIEMEYERLIAVCEQQINRYKGKIEIYKEQMSSKTQFTTGV